MTSRRLLCPLLAALALALGACGSGEAPRERLEDSVRGALDAALERGGDTTADAITASCGAAGGRTRCAIGVTAGTTGLVDRYAVTVAPDGCWTARRLVLDAPAGRDDPAPPPNRLRGCVG